MWKKTNSLNIENYSEDELLHKAYVKAVNLLYRQPYTESKLGYKLKALGYPQNVIDKVIAKLVQEKFLNDEYYCLRRFVTYLERKENSLRDIRFKLLQRGFKSQAIYKAELEVLDDYPQYEYQACLKLLKAKFKPHSDKLEFNKALAYLARKGFSSSIIQQSVETFFD